MTTPEVLSAEVALPGQPLPHWRRAVLKVGSSLLAADGGGLTPRYATALAAFVARCQARGREVVVVSSGAVAAGRALLRGYAAASGVLAAKQALAALGQAPMVALWGSLSDRPVAQVLLTVDDLRDRCRYLNARATLRELLRVGVLPVVNENDTVAVHELKVGDNDNLAAIIAALVGADLLLIASDVDALHDADPRTNPRARPLCNIEALTPEILAMAGGAGSASGTGGMFTKLQAARKAAAAGIPTALFNGRNVQVVQALERDVLCGSLFAADSTRLRARKYWLRHAHRARGRIQVDAGAASALAGGRVSLLPSGVTGAQGEFHRGDLIEIVTAEGDSIAHGLCHYNTAEVRRLAGCHSSAIVGILGYSYGDEIVHRDDLVMIAAVDSAQVGPR